MRGFPLLAGLLLASCSSPPVGGDLAVAVVADDMAGQPGALTEQLAQEASRATLVTRAADGRIAAGLATSWRFLDEGEDLILRLAPLRWPSGAAGKGQGAELDAQDVVRSLRRRSPAARPALAAAGLSGRGTARAPIARVVELAPRPATPYLLDWLAQPALAVTDRRGRPFPGPYARTAEGRTIRLDRMAEAPRPDARPAQIRLETLPAADAIKAFRTNGRQLVLGEGLTGLIEARQARAGQALRFEAVHGVIGLAIRPGGVLADARLRRALLLASDSEALADRIGLATLTAQNRLWDGMSPPADARALPLAQRQVQAAALLAEAGFGPERALVLTVLVPAGAEAELVARQLADSLSPLGIAIRSLRRPAKGPTPRHDLALVAHVAPVPDAVAHLARWGCALAQPCSAEADLHLDAARAAGSDLPARAAAIDRAETALMADPAFVPLLRPLRWALVADGVTGFVANPLGWHPLGRVARGS